MVDLRLRDRETFPEKSETNSKSSGPIREFLNRAMSWRTADRSAEEQASAPAQHGLTASLHFNTAVGRLRKPIFRWANAGMLTRHKINDRVVLFDEAEVQARLFAG